MLNIFRETLNVKSLASTQTVFMGVHWKSRPRVRVPKLYAAILHALVGAANDPEQLLNSSIPKIKTKLKKKPETLNGRTRNKFSSFSEHAVIFVDL